MRQKQRGDITIIVILVLIIVVLGGIFFAERSQMSEKIDTLQTDLGKANANVEKLTGINKNLNDELKLQTELRKVAQEEASTHLERERDLTETVKKLSKKLPAAQPRSPTDQVDPAQEQRSLERITVLTETFCSLNPEQEQCIQPEEPK